MKYSRITPHLAALAMALLVSSSAPLHANDIPRPDVPGDLDPGDVFRAYLVGHAVGTQDYVCLPNGSGGFAWVLYGPQATLFDDADSQIATHFLSPNPDEKGLPRPTWQHARDTSPVWAKQFAITTDSTYVEAGAIPWLLLEVVGQSRGIDGGRRLTDTAWIQRVHTSGGVASATGCTAGENVGAKSLVPYAADYYFYKARAPEVNREKKENVMKNLISKMVIALSLGSLLFARTAAAIAIVDVNIGVISYTAFDGTPTAANTLKISLAGGTYTIDDPAENTIQLGTEANAQGCLPFDSNTVTCPAAGITAFQIQTRSGQDRVDVTLGIPIPASIDGGPEADTLIGGDGDDTILWTPGGGSDVIDGGPGSDRLQFLGTNINEIFTITPEGDGFVLFRNVAAVTVHADDIELLDLTTQGGTDDVSTTPLRNTTQQIKTGNDTLADTLRIDANGRCLDRVGDAFETEGFAPILLLHFDNVIVSDMFCRADPCDGAVPTMGCTVNGLKNQPCQGTDGDDVIFGTLAGDVILGGGGNDRIRGGAGDDLLCGEGGDDAISGGRDNDTIVGGPGDDRLKGDSGNDVVLGGGDDDKLVGGSGIDDLDGGLGSDRLVAGSGDDTLRGGDGLDAIKGGGGSDSCTDTDQIGPFSGASCPDHAFVPR